MSEDPFEARLSAAEDVREDLEAIAESNLPFARDAQQILEALDQAED